MEETSASPERAPRNRTITLTDEDRTRLRSAIRTTIPTTRLDEPFEGIVWGDYQQWGDMLPHGHVDMLFLDPPYNRTKSFRATRFTQRSPHVYTAWFNDIVRRLLPLLKPTATLYICGDWLTSVSIFDVASRYCIVRNRITWEREKGRGAQANWKNASEDIWFCTMSDTYTFNVDQVKQRRQVIAPYMAENGQPKDWTRSTTGNFRDTHPSNIWTDITVPFWSMPENTDHPTQKSEKLLAKLLLASSNPGDFVLDPFLGSGTTAAVAQKLQRRCLGIEIEEEYCLLAARRMELAEETMTIQGLEDGVFWERNTYARQRRIT